MAAAARWAALIAGAWAGGLAVIALMAAPAAFATLSSADAGRFVGRLFAQEAATSLAIALLLVFIERRRSRSAAEAGTGSIFSVEMLLLLGTIFCTVAGYYAVEPLIAEARLGQGSWSFGALHAVSGAFFAVKGLLVLTLAWRYASA